MYDPAHLENITATLAAWAHPELDLAARPTKDWPLMRTDTALLTTAAYLVLVAVGLALRPSNWRDAVSTEPRAKKDVSIGALLTKDPIRLLQIIYNSTQVRSGGGMAWPQPAPTRMTSLFIFRAEVFFVFSVVLS